MFRKVSMALLSFVVAGLLGTAAYAHPELKVSDPLAGSAIVDSPKSIRLSFTEAVIPKFSGIEIRDQTGRVIPTDAAVADPKDRTQLFVPVVGSLAPGTYDVVWHAVGADTHRVQGHFSFKVQP